MANPPFSCGMFIMERKISQVKNGRNNGTRKQSRFSVDNNTCQHYNCKPYNCPTLKNMAGKRLVVLLRKQSQRFDSLFND